MAEAAQPPLPFIDSNRHIFLYSTPGYAEITAIIMGLWWDVLNKGLGKIREIPIEKVTHFPGLGLRPLFNTLQ